MGKKKNIDVDKISELASYGCNTSEIAAILGLPIDVLERDYSHCIEIAYIKFQIMLHKKQYEIAISGNKRMKDFLIYNYGSLEACSNVIVQKVKNLEKLNNDH